VKVYNPSAVEAEARKLMPTGIKTLVSNKDGWIKKMK
jgi:hypothetical protein